MFSKSLLSKKKFRCEKRKHATHAPHTNKHGRTNAGCPSCRQCFMASCEAKHELLRIQNCIIEYTYILYIYLSGINRLMLINIYIKYKELLGTLKILKKN